MAVEIDTPNPKLPFNYVPPGGMAYRVKNGDNWASVANHLGMDVELLIYYNFGTNVPKYVNYYLKHNVGCTVVSPDGKNYSFWNAAPGIIYHPLIPPVTSFSFQPVTGLTLHDDPANPGQRWRFMAHFRLGVLFNKKLPDVRPYVYRQYIRGQAKIRTNQSSTWHKVDATKVPSPTNYGLLVPIHPTNWLEDGKLDNSVVLRYGYREAAPFYPKLKETDMYIDPISTPQTGFQYVLSDEPGLEPTTFFRMAQ